MLYHPTAKTPIECLESWFKEKPELFKVDIETFKNAERGLYLNDYTKVLENMKIAVIGGGISGLATIFYINKLMPEANVFLFEKEEYLGGKIKTENLGGFLFESGSNGFLSNKALTFDFIEEAGLSELILTSNDSARLRYVFHKNKLHLLPDSPKAFLKTKLLSPLAKLRVLAEYFVSAKKDNTDESLQEFGYRRVGKEFTDVFLDVMSAGIFASTPKMLSVNSAFPKIVELEKDYGGLFRAMLAKKGKGGSQSGVLTSFKGGMSNFINELEKKLKFESFKGSEVSRVEEGEFGYKVEFEVKSVLKKYSLKFDKVIFCTPANVTAYLMRKIDREIAYDLASIEYVPMSIVGFGYKKPYFELDGFGLLTTTSSHQDILGVLWDSSIFDDRAPKDSKSLRVMIGGIRNKELALKSKEELVEIAILGLKNTMQIDEIATQTFVKQWKEAIPNYSVGHLQKVNKIFEKIKKHENLYLNSNAYYGVGFNDCIANSKKCAKEIVHI